MGMMTEYYHYFFTTLVSISGGNVFHIIKKSLVILKSALVSKAGYCHGGLFYFPTAATAKSLQSYPTL